MVMPRLLSRIAESRTRGRGRGAVPSETSSLRSRLGRELVDLTRERARGYPEVEREVVRAALEVEQRRAALRQAEERYAALAREHARMVVAAEDAWERVRARLSALGIPDASLLRAVDASDVVRKPVRTPGTLRRLA